MEQFKERLEQAIKAIEDKDLMKAEILVKEAVALCMDAPEGYNLMGILAEYHGDYLQAAKYYRVASALDPTYMPATHNLTRVTRGQSPSKLHAVDVREQTKGVVDEASYYIEYDAKQVGHIKKRG
ncbi:MAG: hypothetical protein ACRCWY_07935 [Cellulosilyticaceae bacterium]